MSVLSHAAALLNALGGSQAQAAPKVTPVPTTKLKKTPAAQDEEVGLPDEPELPEPMSDPEMKQIYLDSEKNKLYTGMPQQGDPLAESLKKSLIPAPKIETPDEMAPHVNGEDAYNQGIQSGKALSGTAQGQSGPPAGQPAGTSQFVNNMKNNPLSVVGGAVNAISPEKGMVDKDGNPIMDSSGHQQTQQATENPDSVINTLKGGIPRLIGNAAPVNALFKLLGLGSTKRHADSSKINLFAGANQAPTPFDSAANEAYADMQDAAEMAPYDEVLAAKYSTAQTNYGKILEARNNWLNAQQTIGIGTPQQSQQYRDSALAKNSIIQSLGNLQSAIQSHNPQRMEGTLSQLIKQGNLADSIKRMSGGSSLLEAANGGVLDKYFSQIGPTAVAKIMKGVLEAAYDNAGVEGRNVERLGNQMQVDPGIAGKFDTYAGKGIEDVVKRQDFLNAINNLDAEGVDEQGNRIPPISEISSGQQAQATKPATQNKIEATKSELGAAANAVGDAIRKAAAPGKPKKPAPKKGTGNRKSTY